jgi:hypothetical protein
MKKISPKKPLRLDRETLRQISNRELNSVPGGGNVQSCFRGNSECDPDFPEFQA